MIKAIRLLGKEYLSKIPVLSLGRTCKPHVDVLTCNTWTFVSLWWDLTTGPSSVIQVLSSISTELTGPTDAWVLVYAHVYM